MEAHRSTGGAAFQQRLCTDVDLRPVLAAEIDFKLNIITRPCCLAAAAIRLTHILDTRLTAATLLTGEPHHSPIHYASRRPLRGRRR
jgi:hypothetical protein